MEERDELVELLAQEQKDNADLRKKIDEMRAENQKLNLVLYHSENGLSHPDLKPEIELATATA